MARLKIVADGASEQAQAVARGRLFETLAADVLRHYGFGIDRKPSVNYSGMEIDIEGKTLATQIPIYAECKCHDTEVDAPKLQAFHGKYMSRWTKDKRCQGLFIALPGVNSHARGYYRDNLEGQTEFTVRLLEEGDVLTAIYDTRIAVRPDVVAGLISDSMGTPGDSVLLYTSKGPFWVQYVVAPGAGIPLSVCVSDAKGSPVSDASTVDYLRRLFPELEGFEVLSFGEVPAGRATAGHDDPEAVVAVRGSSACFEYQFPASPVFFVGRQAALGELDGLVEQVLGRTTSARGILIEANSGWGKSSVILASVDRLQRAGHHAIAVDCRPASSPQFILRVLEHAITTAGDLSGGLVSDSPPVRLTGFDGAARVLLDAGRGLANQGKVMVIFLDQFERVFLHHELLVQIRNLLLNLCDAEANVLFGFAWKADLIGITTEFPYQLRQDIADCSVRIPLSKFLDVETNSLLDMLAKELRAPLRGDLRFFLSEFSQGYPWLLKRLCAHVRAQRDRGIVQADMASNLLNVEQLFEEDLRDLSPEEHRALKIIAKAAPVDLSDVSEGLSPDAVTSLVNRRLVVKVGPVYDVYWDIFRDYLNLERAPAQENYILRAQIGSVVKGVKLLVEARTTVSIDGFRQQAGLSQKSFYNVARDMRLLGLAVMEDGSVRLQMEVTAEPKDMEMYLRAHLRNRLPRNRLVSHLLEQLASRGTLPTDEVPELLARWCPYITASEDTWRMYSRILIGWVDFADLAMLLPKEGRLVPYTPGTEVRERRPLALGRRTGVAIPTVQYSPIETVALRICDALDKETRVDWTGIRRSTRAKALAVLADMGFITRKPNSIVVTRQLREFASSPSARARIFAERAMQIPSFVSFLNILEACQHTGSTIAELASALKEALDVSWRDGTAQTNTRIMLDWARHTGLAPGVFARRGRGPRRGWSRSKGGQQRMLEA
jgi:phage tail protein X